LAQVILAQFQIKQIGFESPLRPKATNMAETDPNKMTPEQQRVWYMNLTPDEKAAYGIGPQALTAAEYTALFTMALKQAPSHDDQGGNIFDTHHLKYMQNTLGTVIPFLDCPATWKPKRDLYTIGGGAGDGATGGGGGHGPPPGAPVGVPPPRAASPAPRQAPPSPRPAATAPKPAAKQGARSSYRAPKQTQAVSNADGLGGRAEDCPEALHEQMLGMLSHGDISSTSLQQRAVLTKKRRTFHGPPAFREAVKWGYLHPSLPAPRGMRWREVVSGVQLVGQAPASLSGVPPPIASALAGGEGGSGAED